ncbi:MAG: tetratricopeptide repeat protein [Burkholderiales bacterium]
MNLPPVQFQAAHCAAAFSQMQAKEPRLTARPEPPRQHLASPWTLLGIAVAVLVTLALIFPGRGVISPFKPGPSVPQGPQPISGRAPSELELKVRSEPGNADFRFALAREQTQAGRIADARAALEPLYNSPDPAVRQRARLEDLKLQIQQMHALPEGSAERERASGQLRQELVAMSQYEWDAPALRELAETANQIGARKARADFYMRIVRTDATASRESIDEITQKVLADGEYLTAAEMYFLAQQRAATREDQRHYFIQAMKVYQAGNMTREALLAGDVHMRQLASDDQTLHFMIRLARSANDLKRAQAYAKRLLHMSSDASWLERWLRALAWAAVPSAAAAEREAATKPKPPLGMRPYDPENYQLAYEVFLAANNVQDAHRVASAAVQQVPNDMRWRERLARVSEWSGRTGQALEQWLYIARRTGTPEAWQAVLRIAPGVADDEALLEAMRYQAAAKQPRTDAQYQAIAAAYERVGRPREAIDFLEQEYARTRRAAILESLAYLHERTGNIEGAVSAYRRLIERAGPTTDRVTMLATLLIRRGAYKDAYELLERHRGAAPPDDVEYLRLLGDLALRLRDDTAARATYERLTAHPKSTLDDFVRLVNLLAPRQPEAAARLAEAAYLRYDSPDMLLTALGLHSQRRDFGAMRRLFAGMSPEMERRLSANPGFLVLRADYRASTGSPQLAEADYRQALRIDPSNRYARTGLIYLLIDRRDLAPLRREMPMLTKLAQDDPELQGTLGSAWLALDEPERALPYLAAKVKSNPDDYLWLLNYADALERNQQSDMAWRVRRHAWFKIREAAAKKERPSREPLFAQARVAIQFVPGDEGLAVIRNLLRQDAEAETISTDPQRKGMDAGTRELVLAWAISTEQYIAAKAWLWTQYGRTLAQPVWAEVNVALAHNDLDTLQRALEEYPDKIPAYDRHEAARRTQQYRLAQDIAFTELERKPYDDEMHLRLTQSIFDMASHAQAGYTSFRRGPIDGHEWVGEAAVWVSPRLRLSFDVSHIDQGLTNASLAMVPANDRLYGVTALWRHAIGETRFALFRRESLAENTGFRMVHERPLGPRMRTRIGLAYNERTFESAALAAGGMRDQAFVDLYYTISKREWVMGELYANRYHTQEDRTKIGSSYGLIWETGHRFRTEYPDWHIRAAGSVNHYSLSGTGDPATAVLNPAGTIPGAGFFLPGSFSTYGIYTGFGTYYRDNYTRALRPFVDVGVSHNTVTGAGYAGLIGVSGSVFGADRLTLYASAGRGGNGTDEHTRELGMRYMYLFD